MVHTIDLKCIAKMGWIQRWAGSYTFISCSFWGLQYYHGMQKKFGINYAHTLFIHRKGTVACYGVRREMDSFGRALTRKIARNIPWAIVQCRLLKQNTDVIVRLMNQLRRGVPTWMAYKKFHTVFERHLPLHVFVKYSIDYFRPVLLKKLLPHFTDARLYSENVYSDTERFFRDIAKHIARREHYNPQHLTCLTQAELERYLRGRGLPHKQILRTRFEASALYFSRGTVDILTGNAVQKLDTFIAREAVRGSRVVRGISAFPGKVRGICRIVLDPFKVKRFNQGDILVTGMTRPEFAPVMREAAAIVSESGGILSHAAIVSREMKKPCIVGTQVATKVFKDGDRVEVDATKGMVRRI